MVIMSALARAGVNLIKALGLLKQRESDYVVPIYFEFFISIYIFNLQKF